MSNIKRLIQSYSRYIEVPWREDAAAAQRVIFCVYDETDEKRLRAGIDDQGKAVRMLGTHMEITERKQAEEALQEKLSYEQLLSSVSALAMETDDLYVFQNKCLTVMGETLNVSRINIFEHHHETDTMDNTFEWVAEGVLPLNNQLSKIHWTGDGVARNHRNFENP